MKILIVEDDSISARVTRSALEKRGYAVTVAPDGEEAWKRLNDEHFPLVISDWMMPRMDGLALCRRVRERTQSPQTYFMLLTAHGSAEDRVEAMSSGVHDFLVKPLDISHLNTRLDVARRIMAMKEELQDHLGSHQHQKIGEILVEQGTITSDQLRRTLEEQSGTGRRLGELLQASGWADEEQVTRARALQMDVPYVAVSAWMPAPEVLALIRAETAARYTLLPLSVESGPMGRLHMAMVDPGDIEAIDLVQRETRRRVEPMLASEGALRAAVMRAYAATQGTINQAAMSASVEEASLLNDVIDGVGDDMDVAEALRQSDEAPVVRFVNLVISDAVRRRASDIHLEPRKKDFEVSYRIDGHLQAIRSAPRSMLAATTSRIKIMAEIDIAERRLPQDGRISLRVDQRGVDLRVSTLPTQFGERIVMRVLDRNSTCLGLDQLGFSEGNQRTFESLIQQPHGIILVTGPTGSGKTTTLYAALNALKSSGLGGTRRNIITCEDPIEYELEGISQSSVNEKAGLTFARQLRAILRQDPDVVLVGEIRDQETAEIAFRAALTGHLVLSTLHCNEAAGAVSRLLDMGVPPFLIASTVNGVIAQRLVARLCPHCRRAPVMPILDGLAVGYEPVGCDQCDNIGTRGRVAIHEVLVANPTIRRLTMERAETEAVRRAGIEAGMVTMDEDGWEKASRGLTTVEEVAAKVGLGEHVGTPLMPVVA